MTDTPNLGLPFIEGSQAQKHVTHNEALRILDAAIQIGVLDLTRTAPPSSPAEGERHVVASGATGAWAGRSNAIATWQDGAWAFLVPKAGWCVWSMADNVVFVFDGSVWRDLRNLAVDNLPHLGINTAASSPNLLSVKSNAALLAAVNAADGGSGDVRLQLSKESAVRTASVFFSDAFSGRAEFGLTGDDNFHLKVSPDGSTWSDALVIDRTTGKITLLGFSNASASRILLGAAASEALAFSGMQVNGAMEVSQENGTTARTSPGYVVDGCVLQLSGTMTVSAAQVADAPPGLTNSVKISVTGAESSMGAGDYTLLQFIIEGYRTSRLAFGSANAQPVSIGFWTKIHRTGTYSGALRNASNNRSYPFTFTQNASDTWEFKTVTVPGDTTGTWVGNTNGIGLSLSLAMACGTTFAGAASAWAGANYVAATGTTNGVAATSDTFQVTGFIVLPGLELPSVARAPLIMRRFDTELMLCQRYYEKSYNYGTVPGTVTPTELGMFLSAPSNTILNGQLYGGAVSLAATKRAAPAMTIYGYNGGSGKVSNPGSGADLAANSGTIYNASTKMFTLYNNSGGSITTLQNNVVFHHVADARL